MARIRWKITHSSSTSIANIKCSSIFIQAHKTEQKYTFLYNSNSKIKENVKGFSFIQKIRVLKKILKTVPNPLLCMAIAASKSHKWRDYSFIQQDGSKNVHKISTYFDVVGRIFVLFTQTIRTSAGHILVITSRENSYVGVIFIVWCFHSVTSNSNEIYYYINKSNPLL